MRKKGGNEPANGSFKRRSGSAKVPKANGKANKPLGGGAKAPSKLSVASEVANILDDLQRHLHSLKESSPANGLYDKVVPLYLKVITDYFIKGECNDIVTELNRLGDDKGANIVSSLPVKLPAPANGAEGGAGKDLSTLLKNLAASGSITLMQEANSSTMGEAIKSDVRADKLVWITGTSGSGKNYLMSQIMSNPERWFSFDDYGSKVNDKWIISVPDTQARKAAVLVGVCDNEAEVLIKFLEIQARPIVVYFIIPDRSIFRAAMTLKASEFISKGGKADSPFVIHWTSKAKMSETEFDEYFFSRVLKKMAILESVDSDQTKQFVVANMLAEGTPKVGWHEGENQWHKTFI